MQNPLSKKKSRKQSTETKNRKSITQFFNTANEKLNTIITNEYKINCDPHTKLLKRKGFSPDEKHLDVTNNPLKKCKQFSNACDDKITSTSHSLHSPVKLKFETTEDLQCVESEICNEIFDDDWDFNNIKEKDSLDLSIMQRCEIISIESDQNKLKLELKNDIDNIGTCYIDGTWLDTPLEPGEIVSVIASRDPSGNYFINNNCGLLVLRPDHLISTTSVVGGVFCRRKAVLQERWKGIDSANKAMITGILIHELVQKALTHNISNRSKLSDEVDNILKESIQILYNSELSVSEVRTDMDKYIGPLEEFMLTYLVKKPNSVNNTNAKWNGVIEKVLDIEENVYCPKLGLKGKIDATLQVAIHKKQRCGGGEGGAGGREGGAVVPLELKSGRATASAEHRGQLVLYGMMLSQLRREDPATAPQEGLLLYLKERMETHEVRCGYAERRGLVSLRNELAVHLAPAPSSQLVDIEDISQVEQQSLPEPITHHSACSNCAYLTLCSLHLWHTDGPKVSDSHPLAKLRDQSLGHLTLKHIEYFLHWTSLLKLEEKAQIINSPLHALWTESEEKRSKRGVCAANLRLKSVTNSGDRFLHIFVRDSNYLDKHTNGGKSYSGPQEGEFSIVGIENRPWIAAGVVTVANNSELHILLERDLSRRLSKQMKYHIDTYESYAATTQNLTNLGVLMEDSERATKLRKIIIEKRTEKQDAQTPRLPRAAGRAGVRLMRALNVQQQRAVLRALAATSHALLRGLPGTGKTQTVTVLIEMLVALKQRVLVTAHTHSAVDTVLSRLPTSLKVMRLGASGRVSAAVAPRCEHTLIQSCQTKEQLAELYDSMEVVGVTCLGANHAMLSKTMFDVCIVDEATQVLQCTVLRPLFSAKRFVLVGDPEQLPPIVKSKAARRLGMEESLFHRLMEDETTSTLQLQYRMNQTLTDVANKVAYKNYLKCANQKVAVARINIQMEKISTRHEDSAWLLTTCSPVSENAVIFLNMNSENTLENDKTLANTEEACVVMALVETLTEGGVSPGDIGVIAPYREQVSLLRRSLYGKNVEVSTVDQFQGRDKSVILYSCTRRYDDGRKVKEGEILNDQRRLAVSVTRAKHKLIVVGDERALQNYAPLVRLIEACKTVDLDHNTIAQLNIKYKDHLVL